MKILETIHNLDGYRETLDTDPKEKVLKRIRKWRDAELSATDWTQLADSPVNKQAWAKYRQSLRDLPASNNDPRQIEFPEKPNA